MRVKDLKIGERATFRMLLEAVLEKSGRNGPYCILSLRPSKLESPISARIWSCERASLIASTPEMSVVTVTLNCGEYNGEKNYVAEVIAPAQDANISEFVETSRIPGDVMYGHLVKNAGAKCFAGTPEQAIFMDIFDAFRDRLLYWPAAVNVHHDYVGGLITHMGTVAINAVKFFSVAAPEALKDMEKKTSAEMIVGAEEIYMMETGSSAFAKLLLDEFRKGNFVDAPSAARRRNLAFRIAEKLTKTYKGVDREVLYVSLLYRGRHSLIADPMTNVLGDAPSDLIGFRAAVISAGLPAEEKVKMIEHSILVDSGNSIRPVTAEAFLALYCEKLADLALRYSENNDCSLCTTFFGAALHDIGKLAEYNADMYGKAEFSVDGRLYGHSMIGLEMILGSAGKLGIDPTSVRRLLNCVAAHHDKKEWGALTSPACEEAEIVAMLDYIDSRMDIYTRRAETADPGTFNDESLRSAGVLVYKPVNRQ